MLSNKIQNINNLITNYMKTVFSSLVALLVLSFSLDAMAQKKDENSYNINRALECFGTDDYETAKEYLLKELGSAPKSAIAYDLLGYVYLRDEAYGNALTSYLNAIKYYPKKDKEGLGRANFYLARTHLCLKDTVSAIVALKKAIKYEPTDNDYKSELADIYFYQKQYEQADLIYQDMLKNTPGRAYPLYGLARNAYNQERYQAAKEYVAKAKLLDGKSTMPHILMMRIHELEHDYKLMLNEAVEVLSMDIDDREAYYGMLNASDSVYQSTINILTRKSFEDKDNHNHWEYLLGHLYIRHKEYKKAIKVLQPLVDDNTEMKDQALYWITDCFEELENMPKVIELCNNALATDSDNAEYLLKRASAKFYSHDLDGAKADYEATMQADPDYGYFCYYRLGWIDEIQGNFEDALESFDKSIALDEEYAYIYMMKGCLLNDHLHQPDAAKECFKKCIEIEGSKVEEGTCRQYAYVGLGNKEKAIEIVDSIIAAMPDDAGVYYDAACVYCRLGDANKGLQYLRTCLEKGYRKIQHIHQDDDMDLIRNNKQFKELIMEYTQKYEEEIGESLNKSTCSEEIVMHEIPITKQGSDTYLIKASINNLPMDFILDTGCSDISLSSVESEFMLKNGYLKTSDIKGNTRYTNATGETHTAKEIIIREIKLGDLVLHNLRGSIIPNQKAPLLLGQNVLTKFGKVEIDHKQQKLRIGVIETKVKD